MKRIFVLIVAILALFSNIGSVSAADAQSYRASLTLSRYGAEIYSGERKCEVIISYDVKASLEADSVGGESFVFYTGDGNQIAKVTGTTQNGLVKTNNDNHGGDFEMILSCGRYYYAEVTVFARIGTNYDSRTVTTSTVWVG